MTETLDWQALSKALDHALELDTDAREDWLNQLQRTEPKLAARVRQVLAHRAQASAHGFLDGVADATLAARPTAALVGAKVGPYVIEAEAGRGGMGSVWRARRADGHFEGVVAIKFLNLAALDSQGERRFRREGLLLGKLDHPNVARLLDAGVQRETNQPYLVLEYVDGMPIDEYCEQRGLDLRARVLLFVDVLEAVAHAHSHLVIHGDIKPSNILVTRAGVVKLLDFGIARLADDEGDHTRTSVSALTPQYAAPEQILGEFITTRTDVHGLGLVLYRLLSGHHAVRTQDRAGGKLLAEVLERDPAPPSTVLAGDTVRRHQLAGDLDNIVAKSLRKSPAERYQSAGAFADDLQRYLNHEPVTARRDTIGYRVGKFVRRHRGSVASALLTALALIAATVVTTSQMIEARRQRDAAIQQSRRADAANNFLQLVLAENRPRDKPLNVDELLDRGAALLEMQFGDDRAFVAEMYLLLGGERSGRNEYNKAGELYGRALAAARESGDAALQLRAECHLAVHESDGGFEDKALERLERVDWERNLARGDWQAEFHCVRASASTLPSDAAGRDRQLALDLRARAIIERAGQTHDRRYTTVLSSLAVLHRARGELPQALEYVQLGGRIHERNGRGRTRSRMLALNNEAVILSDMGELAASHEVRQRLTRQLEQIDPSGVTLFNSNLAISYIGMGQYEAARAALTGVADAAHARGDLTQEIVARLRELTLQQKTGAPRAGIDASIAAIRQLMSDPKRNYGIDQRTDLALAMARRDVDDARFDSARAVVGEALSAAEKKDARRQIARSVRMLAEIELAAREPRKAFDHATRAVALFATFARTPDSSADVGESLLLQARAARALGRAEARASYEHGIRALRNGYGATHATTQAAEAELTAYLQETEIRKPA